MSNPPAKKPRHEGQASSIIVANDDFVPRHEEEASSIIGANDDFIKSILAFVPNRLTFRNFSLTSKHVKTVVVGLKQKPWPVARNIRTGYSRHVFCVAFSPLCSTSSTSPFSPTLATGGRDGSLRLWTSFLGKFTSLNMGPPSTPPRRAPAIRAVAFSPHATYVASALDDGSIHLWPVPKAATISDCFPVPAPPLSFDILPTHVPPGSGVHPYPPVMCIAFFPNGDFLVAGNNTGGLVVYDVATRTQVHRLSAESISISGIYAVSVSSDGLTIAAATSRFDSIGNESGATIFWSPPLEHPPDPSLPTTHSLQFKDFGEGAVYSVAASVGFPQYYASGAQCGVVRLWTLASQFSATIICSNQMHAHTSPVRSVAFSPDSKLLASASDDGSIILWNVPDGSSFRALHSDPHFPFISVSFSPTGFVLASAATGESRDDGTVAIWDCSNN
jgi:WD40 repeat protein